MKYHNALTDDEGQKWEFFYMENTNYVEKDGDMVSLPSTISDFTYRKVEDPEGPWLTLPPWADVAEEWKITLCFFDENEETGDLTFWKVIPS